MKAEMTSDGVIVLYAETSLEAFALKQWVREAHVRQTDPSRREESIWRGSRLLVVASVDKPPID